MATRQEENGEYMCWPHSPPTFPSSAGVPHCPTAIENLKAMESLDAVLMGQSSRKHSRIKKDRQ